MVLDPYTSILFSLFLIWGMILLRTGIDNQKLYHQLYYNQNQNNYIYGNNEHLLTYNEQFDLNLYEISNIIHSDKIPLDIKYKLCFYICFIYLLMISLLSIHYLYFTWLITIRSYNWYFVIYLFSIIICIYQFYYIYIKIIYIQIYMMICQLI
jgi:hypothetical protein